MDRAMGCIMGALLGDAMGTVLEFSQTFINKESVKWAMRLPGGGPHGVAPG
jgi:ADP-ribosylglycohydrolase